MGVVLEDMWVVKLKLFMIVVMFCGVFIMVCYKYICDEARKDLNSAMMEK